MQIGTALGGADKRIRDARPRWRASRSEVRPPSRESAVSLTRSIIDAAAKSGGPPIQPVITRLLLDQRAFRKRHLFGAPRLRMELSLAKAGSSIPVYLPADAEATLPCLAKFRARVLAEVRPQEDYAETAADFSFLCFAVPAASSAADGGAEVRRALGAPAAVVPLEARRTRFSASPSAARTRPTAAAGPALGCSSRTSARRRTRILAEVRPQEDYAESAADSFLCFAVGRVLRGA